jgi:membrane-associated protease RseP (regulator of RpoE activity)
MSSKRRLWTGDWERDSALRAEELAAARRLWRPGEPEPEPDQGGQASAPPAIPQPVRAPRPARAPGQTRRRLPARTVVPVVVALLVIAAVAVALTAVLSSSDHTSANSASVRKADSWLGVQLVAGPGGDAVIETVNPNGAAAFAGLEPGDVISQVDGHAVGDLGAAANAIDAMRSGQQALIVVDRGSAVYSTSFPMPARPGGP